MRRSALLLAVLLPAVCAARAEGWIPPGHAEMQAARPDLFHPETGYRIARQRAATPRDIPAPARAIEAAEARALIEAGAVAVDVGAAFSPRYDELDGTWPEPGPHLSIPGAVWLPEVGRGALSPVIARWFEAELSRLSGGDMDRPLIFFCIADCWMSWNAARRAAEVFGYRDAMWFRLGIDGWRDEGWDLVPIPPVPVAVE